MAIINDLHEIKSKELGIQNLDIGFSEEGLKDYIKKLELEIIEELDNVFNDTGDVVSAINSGWQGRSRDLFLGHLTASLHQISGDIRLEFDDLSRRFTEVETSYYQQDGDMMTLIGGDF